MKPLKPHQPSPETGAAPAGLTLVEMLVSLAATLLLLGIVAQLFSMVGRGVKGSRNADDMAGGMRALEYKIRQDLANATALGITPPLRPEANLGYFELIEGPHTDRIAWYKSPASGADVPFAKDVYFIAGTGTFSTLGPTAAALQAGKAQLQDYVDAVGSDDRLVGDIDDVLLMTVHNPSEPFVGRLDATNPAAQVAQSPYAEVVWYCRPVPATSNPRLYTLYRRQRLVLAHPGASPFVANTNPAALNDNTAAPGVDDGTSTPFPNTAPVALLNSTDVSCRVENGRLVPNTLGDLTKREHRFLHSGNFPYVFDPNSADLMLGGARLGEDIVLTNVIAFDVRVVDRNAEVRRAITNTGADAVIPGDAGWEKLEETDTVEYGAFVDLNWGQQTNPLPFTSQLLMDGNDFRGLGVAIRNGVSTNLLQRATYDTWSTHYEGNGLDDDGRYGADQGINQMDDNNNGFVDEPEEGETRPPYPTRLWAIEVRMRCYEPASRQIRQVTVRHAM